jgi:hypothetical protein
VAIDEPDAFVQTGDLREDFIENARRAVSPTRGRPGDGQLERLHLDRLALQHPPKVSIGGRSPGLVAILTPSPHEIERRDPSWSRAEPAAATRFDTKAG